MRKVIWVLLSIFSCSSCRSGIHRIGVTDFLELNTQEKYSSYNPGKLILKTCCELGELPLEVLAKNIKYNKMEKTVLIEGRVLDGETGDTFPGIDVIVGTLEKIDEIQWYIKVAHRTRVDENGYFSINTSLRREYRLYFAFVGYRVSEYDIGELVR